MDAPKASTLIPYLRSCKQECDIPIEGETEGEIPRWLKGCLIRIGSGLLEIGPDKFNHLFDGMALMHRFDFRDGKVKYQNRFLQSDSYRANMKANRIVVSEFATRGAPDPCKTIFQRFSSFFKADEPTDNDLVNIIMYGNEAFACTETNNIWKIDTETLESLEKVNLRKYLPIGGALAHAHEDKDGTVYNIGITSGYHSYYNIIKFPPKEDEKASPFEKGSIVGKVQASKASNPSYFHSFAMTENYFVLVEQPLYMSTSGLTWAHFISGNYANAMHWDPKSLVRFYVMRRSDGQLLNTSYTANPFFVFHHINAYEDNDHIVVDLCAHESGEALKTMYVKALEEMVSNKKKHHLSPASRARRYVLPLNINKDQGETEKNLMTLTDSEATATLKKDGSIFCTFEVLTGTETWSPELPRINYEKYNGRKYRYSYSIARDDSNQVKGTCLLKVDAETKKTMSWSEEHAVPSEPVFLPEPDPVNEGEDSGVLLASLLYRYDECKVSLLVLDAKTMKEIGRVTFKTTSSVPGDFHGVFVSRKN